MSCTKCTRLLSLTSPRPTARTIITLITLTILILTTRGSVSGLFHISPVDLRTWVRTPGHICTQLVITKLAFYSKMQEEAVSGGNSFSNLPAPTIKEEDCVSEKEVAPEAEYLSARCVLFTYFQGDISSVVDEHFSRALSQSSSYGLSSSNSKNSRSAASWKDGSFPMSQRSFPPSFWNSAYQPSVTASLSSTLGSSHTDLPFPTDPYSSASLHTHLHQGAPESWHPSHHHHHHAYPLTGAIGAQGSAYPRASVHEVYGTHFDPRYGSLLVPSVRPHRLPPATVPAPGPSPCDISKSEAASSGWSGGFSGTGSEMGQGLSLNVDSGLQNQDKSKDLYWF